MVLVCPFSVAKVCDGQDEGALADWVHFKQFIFKNLSNSMSAGGTPDQQAQLQHLFQTSMRPANTGREW